jgi:hypothetical protein
MLVLKKCKKKKKKEINQKYVSIGFFQDALDGTLPARRVLTDSHAPVVVVRQGEHGSLRRSTKGFLATTVVRSMEDSKKTFTQSLHNLNFNIETKFLRFQWNPGVFCQEPFF